MTKQLATINIVLSDDGNLEESSRSHQTGKSTWEVELRPKADANFLNELSISDKANAVGTIIAHELGHIIADIVGEHSQTMQSVLQHGKLPAERQAWAFAEKMGVPINQEMKEKALEVYKRAAPFDQIEMLLALMRGEH